MYLNSKISLTKRIEIAEKDLDYAPTQNPEMVVIPSGILEMGASKIEIEDAIIHFGYAFKEYDIDSVRQWFYKSYPLYKIEIDSFRMSKFLVTNRNFNDFILRGNYKKSDFSFNEYESNHPVSNVLYEEALLYCEWLSQTTNRDFRLPTEAEWEWSARSTNNNYKFPWGVTFNKNYCNTNELGLGNTTPVGVFLEGNSTQGLADLSGNVEEWVNSEYHPYPGGSVIKDHLYDFYPNGYFVLRGGSYFLNGDLCLAYRRHGNHPEITVSGFRLCENIS